MLNWLTDLTGYSNCKYYKLMFLGLGMILLCSCSAFSQGVMKTTQVNPDHTESAQKVYHGNPQVAAAAIQSYFQRRYLKDSTNQLESQLSALGASAGFGTQMAIREGFIKTGRLPENKAFVVVRTQDGGKYFFGDFLNHGLFEGTGQQITVWSLVGGGAQKAGAVTLPDIVEIVKYNAGSLGTEQFGIPRLPKEHQPKELPATVLRGTWANVQAIMQAQDIDPTFWGWVPAMAAQKVIIQNKGKIDPALAAKIVMESALPMSKVDPVAMGVRE